MLGQCSMFETASTSTHDSGGKLDILRDDCRKLLSMMGHEEITRSRKRRWLVGSTSGKDDQMKINSSKYLPESLTRGEDDVSFLNRKKCLQSSSSPLSDKHPTNHIVVDYVDLFDSFMAEKPTIFLESLSSALKKMNRSALENVACAITGYTDGSWTTRGAIKRFIMNSLPGMFLHSKHQEHLEIIRKVSQIFRNPTNFRNHMKTVTPLTSSLLSSIDDTMLMLDDMPTQALVAMNRRLDGATVVPQFPIFITYSRKRLLNKLWLDYEEFRSSIQDGSELPEPLAKALSVVSLVVKEKERHAGLSTTGFYPFTPGIEALQNDILTAIWSIPKIKTDELKKLKDLVDPMRELPFKSFRATIVKYLMEFLFECNEIEVPKLFLDIISFINRKSRRQLDFIRTVSTDEVESLMNVSSQLKQILWDSFLDDVNQEVMESWLESLEDDDGNDFDDFGDSIIMDEDVKPSGFATEGVGDSELADHCGGGNHCIGNKTTRCDREPVCRSDASLKDDHSLKSESGSQVPNDYGSYHNIQSLCDETSLFAHRLIDDVLERLAMTEPEGSGISEDIGPHLLIQAVKALVPSFSQGGLDKAKILMGIS